MSFQLAGNSSLWLKGVTLTVDCHAVEDYAAAYNRDQWSNLVLRGTVRL